MDNLSLQFQNIAAGLNDGARFTTEGSWQFFVSQSPEEINDNPRTHIDPMIDPILSQESDIVSFSEVFGTKQKDHIREKLEGLGYTVYITNAFEMWSQNIPGEHLYNVIGVKEGIIARDIEHKEFRYNRPISGTTVALTYMLSFWKGGNRLQKATHLYSRLANGILDGAITNLVVSKNGIETSLAMGHVHEFNQQVHEFLQSKIDPTKATVVIGDMNIPGTKVLTSPPFSTPDWKSHIDPRHSTYTSLNRFLWGLLGAIHKQTDVVVSNNFVNPTNPELLVSLSDHHAIGATIEPSPTSPPAP